VSKCIYISVVSKYHDKDGKNDDDDTIFKSIFNLVAYCFDVRRKLANYIAFLSDKVFLKKNLVFFVSFHCLKDGRHFKWSMYKKTTLKEKKNTVSWNNYREKT
jgi:hypothetical protein